MGKFPAVGERQVELRPVTAARIAAFLTALEQTGSFTSACQASSPHSKWGARSTWITLQHDSEEFREAVEQAKANYGQKILEEVRRRAVDGVDEPVFSSKGQQARFADGRPAVVRKYSDNLLIHATKNRYIFGDLFAAQVKSESTVTVNDGPPQLTITEAEAMRLPTEERAALAGILRRIAGWRGEAQAEVSRLAQDVDDLNDNVVEIEDQREEWEDL